MTLLAAAHQALAEPERLHGMVEPCDGIETCPCAQAIRSLARAIKRETKNTPEHDNDPPPADLPLADLPIPRPDAPAARELQERAG